MHACMQLQYCPAFVFHEAWNGGKPQNGSTPPRVVLSDWCRMTTDGKTTLAWNLRKEVKGGGGGAGLTECHGPGDGCPAKLIAVSLRENKTISLFKSQAISLVPAPQL